MFNIFKRNTLTLSAPFEGTLIDITEVPDQAFSDKLLGDGIAVHPETNICTAPCDGTITQIFPTNHAYGLTTDSGVEILVHIGLDTVNLKGEGFTRLVDINTKVKKGDGIIKIDFEYIKEQGISLITPLLITNMNLVKELIKDFSSTTSSLILKLK